MKTFRNLRIGRSASAILLSALLPACGSAPENHSHRQIEEARPATIAMPQSIAAEHRELHETLARAASESGEIGAAAGKLEQVLGPHFKREEQIATPPLGLLSALASGPVSVEMADVLPMTDALEQELPEMMREHDGIRAATMEFRAVAERAGRADYVRFADGLAAHARQEEEILYPAAILVGRYVKQGLPSK